MKNRVKGGILIALGIALIASAFLLGGYNLWDDSRAQASASDVLARLPIPQTPPTSETVPQGSASATEPAVDPVPEHVLDPHRSMPTMEVDGYAYIGKVSVPALELELPVMDTWDYSRLKIAPCRYVGSAYLPGFVICAHNYASHFGRLKNLSPGDSVLFTDADGNVFPYAVEKVEILAPTAVEEMKSDDWDLTLFTCTIGGRTRVSVRCRRVSEIEMEK